MSMNPLEAIFVPDVIKSLNAHTQALNALTKKMDDLSALTAVGGTSGVQSNGITRISLPVSFDDLLQMFIAAYPEEVEPFYSRFVVNIPAGQTINLADTMPNGNQGAFVYQHVMAVDYYSPNILITHRQDNDPPLIDQVPALGPVTVDGAFLKPIKANIFHTVTNNESIDVNFIDNVQAALMSQEFVSNVFIPLMTGQIDLLRAESEVFKRVNI